MKSTSMGNQKVTMAELEQLMSGKNPPKKQLKHSVKDLKVISKKVRCAIENDFDFQPGCEKCELGKIKVDNPDGFGWKTETCGCYFESELLNQVLSATKKSNLPLSILKAYPMDDYTEERITLELLKEYVYGELMKEWLYLA